MMPLGGGNPSAGEERPENKLIPARLEKQTGTEPFLRTAQETGNRLRTAEKDEQGACPRRTVLRNYLLRFDKA